MLSHMQNHLKIFICSRCGGKLRLKSKAIFCLKCHHQFQVKDDIPLLFYLHNQSEETDDITQKIKNFYEQTPFPNYDGLETVNDLINKSKRNIFTRLLNEQIPFNLRVLEIGCGTGQLSSFLGIPHRHVFGTDMSVNSLKLAQNFKQRHELNRVGFYQMNLFKPIFKSQSFSLVICNGVLHHTNDPFKGFQSIAKLVKPGGYIMIGLYHRYGRLITDARRFIFNITGDIFKFLDPRLKDKTGKKKKDTWFLDQYKNPHESKHTFKEVLNWLDRTEFEFINSIPQLKAFTSFSTQEKLFEKHSRGNWLDHLYVNFKLLMTGGREGGLFIMIGRKKV